MLQSIAPKNLVDAFEDLQATIEQIDIVCSGQKVPIRCNIGVCIATDQTLDVALKRANDQLFHAKFSDDNEIQYCDLVRSLESVKLAS